MKSAFPNPNPGNNGQNGPGNNGQNGGNRRGRFNDPAVRDAMKQFFERPETKAKMAEFQSQDEKINTQFTAAANRILTKRQSAAYKKMQGAPFDLSKIRGGGPPWARNANANESAASKAGSDNQASTRSTAGTDDAAVTPATQPSTAKSTAKPKRKSLRELRGIPGKSD